MANKVDKVKQVVTNDELQSPIRHLRRLHSNKLRISPHWATCNFLGREMRHPVDAAADLLPTSGLDKLLSECAQAQDRQRNSTPGSPAKPGSFGSKISLVSQTYNEEWALKKCGVTAELFPHGEVATLCASIERLARCRLGEHAEMRVLPSGHLLTPLAAWQVTTPLTLPKAIAPNLHHRSEPGRLISACVGKTAGREGGSSVETAYFRADWRESLL